MDKKAYITLLSTNNYIYYLIALIDSYKKTNSKYPLYVVVTEEISKDNLKILNKLKIPYILKNTSNVRNLINRMTEIKMVKKFINALVKLEIFNLIQFDKCIYLDSDLVLYKNIDELFDKPEWSAVEDCLPYHKRPQNYIIGESSFCSGMFVFKPNIEFYNKIISNLSNMPQEIKWHDQNILAYYNQDWMQRKELHLPAEYDLLIAAREDVYNIYIKNGGEDKNIKVKHFVTYKDAPYKKEKYIQSNVYDQYYKYYTYINSIIDKYKINISKINLKNLKLKR